MPQFIMRDGSTVPDARLGCLLVKPDPRNHDYPLQALPGLAGKEPISKRWTVTAPMDQGAEGCCVSMGLGHELFTPDLAVDPLHTDVQWCVEHIYWPAQQKDPWPGGEFPGAFPKYSGTSLEAGLKVVRHDLHLAGGYHWGKTARDVMVGIGHYRPAVLALPWLEGMSRPDRSGLIKYRGALQGGHCLLADEVKLPRWRFNRTLIGLQQSWGPDHGIGGRVYITEHDLDMAMAQGGQAAWLDGRICKTF